jgi:hypothetical protein
MKLAFNRHFFVSKSSVLGLLFFLSLMVPIWVLAQTPEAALKQANDALRAGQSAFFNAKWEIVKEHLQTAGQAISELEAAAPNHAQLGSLKTRHQKLEGDLAKRVGSTSPAAASSTAPAKAPPPPAASTPNLPRNTREALRVFGNEIKSLDEYHRGRLQKAMDTGPSDDLVSLIQWMTQRLDQAQEQAKKLKELAASEGAGEHPQILEIAKRWEEIQQSLRSMTAQAQSGSKQPAIPSGPADAIISLWNSLREEWFNPLQGLAYESGMESMQQAYAKLAEYRSNVLPDALKTISEFEKTYGTDRDAIEKKLKTNQPGLAWEEIKREMKHVDNAIEHLYRRTGEELQSAIDALSSQHDFFRLAKHGELLQLHTLAKTYAVGKVTIPDVPKLLQQDKKALDAKIAAAKWPSCQGDKALRAGVESYLKERWIKDSKHGYSLVGFSVTGTWSVQSRSITKTPTSYGIPVTVAFQTAEDKNDKVARMFELTLRTPVSGKPEMKPPFDSDTVGNSALIAEKSVR